MSSGEKNGKAKGKKTGPAGQQAKQKMPGQSKIRKERSARQAKNQATRELKCEMR